MKILGPPMKRLCSPTKIWVSPLKIRGSPMKRLGYSNDDGTPMMMISSWPFKNNEKRKFTGQKHVIPGKIKNLKKH